jgi:hypothetical protein
MGSLELAERLADCELIWMLSGTYECQLEQFCIHYSIMRLYFIVCLALMLLSSE